MNLGELYIKINVDTSGIDSLKKSFTDAASAAESAGSRIDNAFKNAGSGASGASSSTDDLGKALEQAAAKGQIFADAIESAFSTAINLAQQAASAIGGFLQEAVGQFADYQQNMGALNATFGADNAAEFKQWMLDNSAALGLSINEMMASANKTGTVIQKDLAQRRAEEAAGEQQSTEQQKQELSNRLSNLRAYLSNQLAETREAQAAEYDSWRDYYANVLSELKENLQDEYDELRKSLDARVSAQQAANERELRNKTRALEDSYNNLKDSLSRELDVLKDSLDERVEARRKANEKELRERTRSLEDSYEATKRSLDSEVDAFNAATNARIKEINREYTERYKLIDEEKYAQLKAIQDRIDAIDEEREATKRGKEDSKNEAKLAELNEQYVAARRKSTKAKLQKEIDELELSMRETQYDRELVDEKSALKKEMDTVRDHFDDMKSELKEQQSEEVSQYKDTRANELAALKQSNSDKLKEIKRANQDELQELKDAQKQRIEQIKNDNEETLREAKEHNEKLLNERKRANQDELQALRDRQKAQIESMREENSRILEEKQKSNNQILKEQSDFNEQQLKNLKASQNAELREIQEHNRLLLQEQQNYISQQRKLVGKQSTPYAAPNEEDKKSSMETLKRMFKVAADVGAARNMTTSDVVSIFEAQNYGRFATFDNLGLGYANKTGIQQMVADMASVRGEYLDPENFDDVTKALETLIDTYGYTGLAQEEAEKTVSGSFNRLRTLYSDFMTAIGTEDTKDDDIVMRKLFGTGDHEHAIKDFIDNVTPVIQRVVEAVTRVLNEYGPQIAETLRPLVETVVNGAAAFIKEYGPTIVEAVIEIFGKVHDSLPPDMQNMFDGIKTAVEVLAGVFAAFAASQAVMAFSSFFETLTTSVIPAVSSAMTGTVIPALQNFMVSAEFAGAGVQAGLISPLEALSSALGPIGGPIGAIIALLVAMVANSENLRNVLGDIITTIGGGLMSVLDALSPILDLLVGLWNKLMEAAKALGDFIAQVFGPMWERLKETLGPPLQDLIGRLKDIFEKVKDIVLKVADAIGSVLGPVLNAIGSVLSPILEMLGAAVGGVLGVAIEVLSGLAAILQGLFELLGIGVDVIASVFGKVGEFIDWLVETGKPVIEGFGNVIDTVTNFFKNLGEQIRQALDNPLKWLEEAGKNAVEGFKNGLNEKLEELKSWVTEQFRRIAQTICDALGIHSPSTVLEEIGKNTTEGFKLGLSGEQWEEVKSFVGSIGENIKGFFNGAGSWLTEKGNGIINGLKGGIDSVWPNVQSFFGGVNQNIQDHFNGSDGWLNGDGNDIINGMQNGIDSAWSAVQSFFGGVNGEILQNFFNSDWWLNGDGRNIIDGLNNGLNDAYSAIDNFFGNIPSSIGNMFYDAGDWLVSNGQNIMNGLYNGLVDVWNNTVAPFISGMGSWMHMNDGPEQQDKKVLFKNGQWFMEGLDEGLQSRFPLIQKSIDEVVGMMDVGSTITSNYENNVSKGKQRFINVNIDNMSVRNDQDIYEVAYQLDNIWSREMMGAL